MDTFLHMEFKGRIHMLYIQLSYHHTNKTLYQDKHRSRSADVRPGGIKAVYLIFLMFKVYIDISEGNFLIFLVKVSAIN